LNFGYRSLRILKEISEANPDILCMQEFNYHRVYTPLLNKLDYDLEHYLQEKKYLQGKGDSHMGLAIAYKRSKYKLVGEPYLVEYADM